MDFSLWLYNTISLRVCGPLAYYISGEGGMIVPQIH